VTTTTLPVTTTTLPVTTTTLPVTTTTLPVTTTRPPVRPEPTTTTTTTTTTVPATTTTLAPTTATTLPGGGATPDGGGGAPGGSTAGAGMGAVAGALGPAATAVGARALAFTGSPVGWQVFAGALAIALGSLLVLVAGRPPRTRRLPRVSLRRRRPPGLPAMADLLPGQSHPGPRPHPRLAFWLGVERQEAMTSAGAERAPPGPERRLHPQPLSPGLLWWAVQDSNL
jgi:hypothetical protein